MPKKFDTNPLDPNFPERIKNRPEPEVQAYTAPQRTPYSTAEFPTRPPSVTEDETQRFTDDQFQQYAYQGGALPAAYQMAGLADMNRAGERKESKTGLPEKWLVGLPYVPFTIGLIAGLILLLIIPKEENKVRFHAAQGLAAHVGILIVTTLLGVVGRVANVAELGSFIFTIVTTILLIVFAIKAWRGKPVHIESLDDLSTWLEDKIGPLRS